MDNLDGKAGFRWMRLRKARRRWEAGTATRAWLVRAASFRTWPGWRVARPPPTSRPPYRKLWSQMQGRSFAFLSMTGRLPATAAPAPGPACGLTETANCLICSIMRY